MSRASVEENKFLEKLETLFPLCVFINRHHKNKIAHIDVEDVKQMYEDKYGQLYKQQTVVDNKDFLYHSQRISITNNKLNGIFELQVDENLIYLNNESVKQINKQIEESISNELWLAISDYDFYIDIKFELDRYTGNLTAEFELDSNEVIYYILNEFLYEGLEELLPDISGFSFNAECKKLEEKLF